MNLNLSTYPTLVKSIVQCIPLIHSIAATPNVLVSLPGAGMHAECSKLQENVYFMVSYLV